MAKSKRKRRDKFDRRLWGESGPRWRAILPRKKRKKRRRQKRS